MPYARSKYVSAGVVVRDQLRVEAGDLVHREVRVERVRVRVRPVVEAVLDWRRWSRRAPPVLDEERGVVDRARPDRVEVVVERGHLGGDRRLRVLLGQELAVRPSPVVAPAAAAGGAALGRLSIIQSSKTPFRSPVVHCWCVDHERGVPLQSRVDRLDDVELQRRGHAGAVADGDVVLPELLEAELIDLVVRRDGPQRRDRRLRGKLRASAS